MKGVCSDFGCSERVAATLGAVKGACSDFGCSERVAATKSLRTTFPFDKNHVEMNINFIKWINIKKQAELFYLTSVGRAKYKSKYNLFESKNC